MITIIVPGEPVGRPRPRSRAFKDRSGRLRSGTYHPSLRHVPEGRDVDSATKAWARANIWHDEIKRHARSMMPDEPWEGPVEIDIDFYFPRPQYMLKPKYPRGAIYHTSRPDRDNCEKAVLDALKECGLFKDDSQVCTGTVTKWYVAVGMSAGAKIQARSIT